VDAFAVLPNPLERGEDGFTDAPKTLADLGVETAAPAVVDHPCPNSETLEPDPTREPRTRSLLLQFSKPTDEQPTTMGSSSNTDRVNSASDGGRVA
jgi:hypothetical protein